MIIITVVLSIGLVISWALISNYKQEIKSKKNKISQLQNDIDDLENEISILQNEKKDLQNQVNDLEEKIDNSNNSFYGTDISYQPQIYSPWTNIDESDVYSSQGTAIVVYRESGCDYMILENSNGYIVVEWMGGNDPDKGDKIGGNVNTFGTKEFYNISRNSKTRLWVDDYSLSKDRALEKMFDKCH